MVRDEKAYESMEWAEDPSTRERQSCLGYTTCRLETYWISNYGINSVDRYSCYGDCTLTRLEFLRCQVSGRCSDCLFRCDEEEKESLTNEALRPLYILLEDLQTYTHLFILV